MWRKRREGATRSRDHPELISMPIQCKQPLHQIRDGVDAMAYLNAETYREREAQWREQAAYLAARPRAGKFALLWRKAMRS